MFMETVRCLFSILSLTGCSKLFPTFAHLNLHFKGGQNNQFEPRAEPNFTEAETTKRIPHRASNVRQTDSHFSLLTLYLVVYLTTLSVAHTMQRRMTV